MMINERELHGRRRACIERRPNGADGFFFFGNGLSL
jgi:hypothetical protein